MADPSPDSSPIVAQIVFCGISVCVVTIGLCVVHRIRPFENLNFPRHSGDSNLLSFGLRIVNRSFFVWLSSCWTLKFEDLLRHAGPDAAAVIVFLNCFTKFFSAILPITLAAIFSVHWYHDSNPEPNSKTNGGPLHSAGSLPPGSNYLYIHIFCTALFVFLFYFFVLRAYDIAIRAKSAFAVKCSKRSSCAVLVCDVPHGVGSADLLTFFETLHLGPVTSAVLLRNSQPLYKALSERQAAVTALENLVDTIAAPQAALTCPLPPTSPNTTPLSLVSAARNRIARISGSDATPDQRFLEARAALAVADAKVCALRANYAARSSPSSTALVSFSTPFAAATASRAVLSTDPSRYNVSLAPFPEDLIHYNLVVPNAFVRIHRLIANLFVLGLIIFSVLITGSIATMTQLDKLEEYEFIQKLLKSPFIGSLIQSVLPTLFVTIYIALIPTFLTILAKQSLYQTQSHTSLTLCTNFFYFQLINVPLVYAIGPVALELINGKIPDASAIPDTVASSLVNGSVTAFNFILLQACLSLPLGLLLIVPMVRRIIFGIPKTPRARFIANSRPVWEPIEFSGTVLCLTMGLMFSVLCPLVLLPTLIFALSASLVWRYRLAYQVSVPDTKGRLFSRLISMMHFALFLFVVITSGLLAVKKFKGAPLIAPIFIFLIYMHFRLQRLAERIRSDSLESWRDWELDVGELRVEHPPLPTSSSQGVAGLECSHPHLPYGDSLLTALPSEVFVFEYGQDYFASLNAVAPLLNLPTIVPHKTPRNPDQLQFNGNSVVKSQSNVGTDVEHRASSSQGALLNHDSSEAESTSNTIKMQPIADQDQKR